MQINYSFIYKFSLMFALAFVSACNTVPSSSSSSNGSPSSGGSSGSSSPSSGSSGSRGSQSGSSSSSGSGMGQIGSQSGVPVSQAGSQNGGMQEGQHGGTGQGAKTDDEILADALGEFGKERNNVEHQGEGENGESSGVGEASTSATLGAAGGSGQGGLTEEERAGVLNAQLNDKFAKFDDLMLGERERVSKGENETGSGSGYEDGADDGSADEPLQTAMVDQPAMPGRAGFPGDIRTEDLPPAPSDVDDGQDDDIIARQLREAAQKERDPELRAKLWEEYRKYKKGA
jgi:hypothetical protein